MSSSNDDEFVTISTKHRKKQPPAASSEVISKKSTSVTNGESSSSNNNSNISLRPRTMFAMKGRGRTESESSAYRPQWSKDGEGFVSASAGVSSSMKDPATGNDENRGDRRKNKVMRYTKEELLALYTASSEVPDFPPETTVASEQSLPPVSTLPFDYEDVYKQWSLNRTRGRGRGRVNPPVGGQPNARGQQDRAHEVDGSKSQRDEHYRHNERDPTWERGAKITEGLLGDDAWDDVLESGADINEMDLSSMAEAAEKFRHEMNAMREELEGPKVDPNEIKDDMDAFDKKLEDAAATGQFDDSDHEDVQWDDVNSEGEDKVARNMKDSVKDHTENLLAHHSSQNQLFDDAQETSSKELVFEKNRNSSLALMAVGTEFADISPLHPEVVDEWFYLDPQGLQQGPFKTAEMREWFEAGYFKPHLPIRFGRKSVFIALASQFVHGQMPFTAPPGHINDLGKVHTELLQHEQLFLDVQLQQQREQQQQQQQQQLIQHQQQQQQRIRQQNQEEKVHVEMQRLEIARQQQQTQLYQQQQILQRQQEQQRQQQLQMLLQQQSSWQSGQRESIMSALSIFGGNPESVLETNNNSSSDSMQDRYQLKNRSQTRLDQLSLQNTQTLGPGAMLNLNEGQRRDQAFWPNIGPEMGGIVNSTGSLGNVKSSSAAHNSTRQSVLSSPTADLVADAWLTNANSPDRQPPMFDDIQNEEKRRAALETRKYGDRVNIHNTNKDSSPDNFAMELNADKIHERKMLKSPYRKDRGSAKSENNVWATESVSGPSSTSSKSLKDIQREEQLVMLQKKQNANLTQMGVQLKMMLGVNSVASKSNDGATQVSFHTLDRTESAVTARSPPTSVASPWGAPATVNKSNYLKSMRDIFAEEERLAQERAEANENAPVSSHWMNVVAGNKVAAAAIPKPARSVLGPVPASVLKSRQQKRVVNGVGKSSVSKAESDSSFWNFGAARPADMAFESSIAHGDAHNAFGSSKVSSEFMGWALKQLLTIDSKANVTLLEYVASVEDPGEIREYLAAYLGSTPRVSAFATEFIQRKKSQDCGNRSPGHHDAQQRASEAGTSNKRGKRRVKSEKIDTSSLINYSVGS